jgi:hypothetical protein
VAFGIVELGVKKRRDRFSAHGELQTIAAHA